MKYYYKKPDKWSVTTAVNAYDCPYARSYTLYSLGDRKVGVVQQRFNPKNKSYIWTSIDPWLIDEIGKNCRYELIFDKFDGKIVTVRTIMWTLRMKPLRRKDWEDQFARKESSIMKGEHSNE